MLDGLYAIMRALGGSFSAEHGVGRSRRDVYWDWLPAEQRTAVQAIKTALDPHGIMNPGALIPE
jgi:FAD/FMN-containing dehydrogenase